MSALCLTIVLGCSCAWKDTCRFHIDYLEQRLLHTKYGVKQKLTQLWTMGCSAERLHIKQRPRDNGGFVRWEEERVHLECKGRGHEGEIKGWRKRRQKEETS